MLFTGLWLYSHHPDQEVNNRDHNPLIRQSGRRDAPQVVIRLHDNRIIGFIVITLRAGFLKRLLRGHILSSRSTSV